MKNFIIIIPVFNPPKSFIENLRNIASNELSILEHILIVDDGSTNNTLSEVASIFPSITQIRGSGNLWWGGGMHMGMEYAINHNYDVVVWLNHDCTPDLGTIQGLVDHASKIGIGAVSAWCYCKEDPRYAVNPGFRNFREIPINELQANKLLEVDGVNGNCTAISVEAIKKVGLPRVDLQPHYADGPYTWRLHQHGYKNFVAPNFRTALEREFDRCVDEKDHSMFWHVNLPTKFKYYLFSYRSKYHYKHRFFDMIVFRGRLLGILAYPIAMMKLFIKVTLGHLKRNSPLSDRLESTLTKYDNRFPSDALRRDLIALNNQR